MAGPRSFKPASRPIPDNRLLKMSAIEASKLSVSNQIRWEKVTRAAIERSSRSRERSATAEARAERRELREFERARRESAEGRAELAADLAELVELGWYNPKRERYRNGRLKPLTVRQERTARRRAAELREEKRTHHVVKVPGSPREKRKVKKLLAAEGVYTRGKTAVLPRHRADVGAPRIRETPVGYEVVRRERRGKRIREERKILSEPETAARVEASVERRLKQWGRRAQPGDVVRAELFGYPIKIPLIPGSNMMAALRAHAKSYQARRGRLVGLSETQFLAGLRFSTVSRAEWRQERRALDAEARQRKGRRVNRTGRSR